MDSYAKNFGIGILAGSSATLVSHPFQRLKMEFQNSSDRSFMTRENLTNPRWLYKGLVRAMCTYSIEKMMVFGIYNSMKQKGYNSSFSGAVSGMFASLTITPGEQLVSDIQNGVRNFKIGHLFKGLKTTLLREIVGFTVHFSIYDFISEKFNKDREVLKTIACGSVAIVGGWSVIYPVDTIKTQIQAGVLNYKTCNFKHLYRGFGYALCRAIPFHVTCFLVMEECNKYL